MKYLLFVFALLTLLFASPVYAQEESDDLISLDPASGLLTESTFVSLDNPMSYDVRYTSGINPRDPDCITSRRFSRPVYVKGTTSIKLIACDAYRRVSPVVRYDYKVERPDLKRRDLSSIKRGSIYTVRPTRTKFYGENYRPMNRQASPVNRSTLSSVPYERSAQNMYFTMPSGDYDKSFVSYLVYPENLSIRYEMGPDLESTADPVCGSSPFVKNDSFKITETVTIKYMACSSGEAVSDIKSVSYVINGKDENTMNIKVPQYIDYSRPVRSKVRFRSQTMKGEPVIKTL